MGEKNLLIDIGYQQRNYSRDTRKHLLLSIHYFQQPRWLTVGNEGFIIRHQKSGNKNVIVIAANSDVGVLYGVFHFLRLLQTNQNIQTAIGFGSPKNTVPCIESLG